MLRKAFPIFLISLSLLLCLFVFASCDKSSSPEETKAQGSDNTATGDTKGTSEESTSDGENESTLPCSHSSTEWVIDTAATCKNTGTRHRECTDCGATVENATIPTTAHTEKIVEGKEASCKEAGLTEGKICSVCETVLVEQTVIEKKPHTEKTLERVQSTCNSTGLTEGKICSVCGTVLVAQETTPTKSHTEVIVEGKAATCTEDGITSGKICSACDAVIIAQQTIPATDHDESDWIIDTSATTDSTGSKHIECTVCGETLEEAVIPAIDEAHEHSEEGWVITKPASCTEEGIKNLVCSCGHIIKEVAIPVSSHTEEILHSISPTCNKVGLTEGKKCSVCGEILVAQEPIPTVDHIEETVPGKTPTCTEAGLTTGKKCSSCGLTLVAQSPISKVDHIPQNVLGKKPTCTAGGTTDGTKCSVCGNILTSQLALPPNGHSFKDGICTVCGVNEKMGIWIVDGLGNPMTDIIVKVMQDGKHLKMYPYKGEFLSLDLTNGNYQIELDLSSLKGNYTYDAKSCVITPDKPSITVRLFETLDSSTAEDLYVSYPLDKDYTANRISVGSYKLTLTPNDYTFFIFTPEKAANYVFTYECESNLSIGYHGGTFFVQGTDLSDSSTDFTKLDNGLSFNIYASNLGGSFVFSVKSTGATECILNLKDAGDPGTRVVDEPWTPYLEDEEIVKAQLAITPEGSFTAIDLSDLSITAVYNSADGYYHLGDENGEIIFIDLTTSSKYIASVQTICANQRMGAYIYDDSGKLAEKRSYNELFMQYGMPSDSTPPESPIRIPLTEKLAEAIKNFGTNNNWWKDGSESNIFTPIHKTEPYNSEYAWLLYCGIYQ